MRTKTMKSVVLPLLIAVSILGAPDVYAYNAQKVQRFTVRSQQLEFRLDCVPIFSRSVGVNVPTDLDLNDDSLAREIVDRAAQWATEECGGGRDFRVTIALCRDMAPGRNVCNGAALVFAKRGSTGRDIEYQNDVVRHRQEQEAAKQAAERQRLAAEQRDREIAAARAQAEQQRLDARKRLDEFIKQFGVRDWPRREQFNANPFLYERRVIAIAGRFNEMLSATEGLFSWPSWSTDYFIVSNVPTGTFRSSGACLVAGKVVGKREVAVPGGGRVLVPQLSFVGVHVCETETCSDIIAR